MPRQPIDTSDTGDTIQEGFDKSEANFAELYTGLEGIDTTVAWDEVENKPQTFPATWSEVADKPATYPPSAHTHHNYQALLETNLDLLMRGLLYTKAQPFSQSFTFSGDGTRTAFKIPRASVNQQGWVRGGVSATVDGAAASGTWNIHTQTYTLSAAPANGASVVVSSTDVVPYQGRLTQQAQVEIVYTNPRLLLSTSGTGKAPTGFVPPSWPMSVKMPISDASTDDDTLLLDAMTVAGFASDNAALQVPYTQKLDETPLTGAEVTASRGANAAAKRGGMVFNASHVWGTQSLSQAVPHLSLTSLLCRVTDSAEFADGELVLAMVSRRNSSAAATTSARDAAEYSADLYRLNNGPVVEAA